MRPIKFRAWDKKLGNWVHDVHFRLKLNGMCYDPCQDNKQMNNDFIMQQYIDRKDKNKVELYEGDILRTKSGWVGYIVYMNAGYILVQHEDENGEMMTRPEWDKCEKIGTKFENPKLLERK